MTRAPRSAAAQAARGLVYAALLTGFPGAPAARADTPRPLLCTGADTMQGLIARWAEAFGRRHSGQSVSVDSHVALSADGLTALLAGKAGCVTFAREMFPAEVAAYEAHFGVPPRPIPIAGGSFATPHATHAIAIYVNDANPLAGLTRQQLRRLFAAGPAPPTRWGELGLGGRWRDAPIHVYGMAPYRPSGNPPGIVNYLRIALLHGQAFRADLRVVANHDGLGVLPAIVRRVAADPDGVGYSGFAFAAPGAKALPIARRAGTHALAGTAATVAAGQYPLARTVYVLFAPNSGVAFARFALGPAGQALVPLDAEHFLPLTRGKRARALAMLAMPVRAAPAARLTRDLRSYVARPVRLPAGARYLRPDGSVAIVGYNDMRAALAAIDILFTAAHPGVRFALDLQGTRTAPAALMRGTSLIAPMGAPFEDAALARYRLAVGARPLAIRVAHDALDPQARSSPLAVFVRRDEPLAGLSLSRLARIFAPPPGTPALRRWRDLGDHAPHATRPIHPLGPAPWTALGHFLTRHAFAGRPFAHDYRGFAESREVIAQELRDPDGIAIADLNQRNDQLRLVALAGCALCPPSRGSAADLIADRYPLDRRLLIYLRRTPAGGIDPLAREYLRLVLSREGQTAIAAAPPHYLPLDAADAQAGLDALRRSGMRRR
ncbi:MAG TPA: substrate-binding domain-containing protein [Steroidobacteraceae bacterium]|nr:substrate-binding domain-containing protein [Steroidobacteraceae bacterium]